jgi:hypothetical protein
VGSYRHYALGRLESWRSNQNGRLETVNRGLMGRVKEYSFAQVSAQNRGANLGTVEKMGRFYCATTNVRRTLDMHTESGQNSWRFPSTTFGPILG